MAPVYVPLPPPFVVPVYVPPPPPPPAPAVTVVDLKNSSSEGSSAPVAMSVKPMCDSTCNDGGKSAGAVLGVPTVDLSPTSMPAPRVVDLSMKTASAPAAVASQQAAPSGGGGLLLLGLLVALDLLSK